MSINAAHIAKNIGVQNNVRDESPMAMVGLFDLCVMQIIYECGVYLLNLWLVFQTESPLDMILNAVALEFVTTLDSEYKSRFFEIWPEVNDHITAINNQEVERGKGYYCYIGSLACASLFIMLLMFPALLFMMVWGPLCKPKGII